jgi:hypothetical protein
LAITKPDDILEPNSEQERRRDKLQLTPLRILTAPEPISVLQA